MSETTRPGDESKPKVTSQGMDPMPTRIGVVALGLIALLCVGALIVLSFRPESPGTTQTGSDVQQTAPAEDTQPAAAGPVAAEVASDTGSLGVLSQIVGVLGTVAAAAVGGIAGLLTGTRAGSATTQT